MTEALGRKRLNVFERYLTLWVAGCMVVGVVIDAVSPGVTRALRSLELGEASRDGRRG